jgi:diguanylate cyclase (GGDEF)-like protein/PAS domain S-box-containing protein
VVHWFSVVAGTLMPDVDPRSLALAVGLALASAYVVGQLVRRARAAEGGRRLAWLCGGGAAMALGLWSVQFVGILALSLSDVAAGSLLIMGFAVIVAAINWRARRTLERTVALNEARYRALTHSATDAIVSADSRGRIVSWNLAAERTFGYTDRQAVGRPLTILIPEHYRDAHRQGVARLAAGEASSMVGRVVELEGLRRDGSTFPIELSLSRWSAGDALYFTGIIRDISQRKRADAALRESEVRFRNLVERSPEAIVLHSRGQVFYANPAAAALVGVGDGGDLTGRPILQFVHPDSLADVRQRLSLGRRSIRSDLAEYRIVHSDGSVRDVEVLSAQVTYGGRLAVQTHLRDVTDRKALERQLSHEAFHDTLTGLANRALFIERVERALARSARHGHRPAVFFLDVDNFKTVNDALGHAAGDELLQECARRLQRSVRDSDTCARLSGDEFSVLVEDFGEALDEATSAARCAHMAERLLAAMAEPMRIGDAELVVGASVGIALARPDEAVADLLRNADLAMYKAKSRGKNRYQVFESAMHDEAQRQLELEADLRRAVALCGRLDLKDPAVPFTVHYQPITALDSRNVIGFEALIRWQHTRLRELFPMQFIPLAEQTELIGPLGRWLLRRACSQIREWQLQFGDATALFVTINVSPRLLLQADLPIYVSEALEESGLPPFCLTLELTESMLVDNSDTTLVRLKALKALGIRLAIDDFGTGLSSLRYLERFPVDVLKIDRSFVDRLGLDGGVATGSPLARAILRLGEVLGIGVVAEGIETEAQLSRLRELGCEFGQGFLLARPEPPGAAVKALVATSRRLAALAATTGNSAPGAVADEDQRRRTA